MKIGIITFYYNNNNFGGQLQARALVRAISGLGKFEVEQIPYDYVRAWKKIPYKTRFLKSICQAFSSGVSAGIEFLVLRVRERRKLNSNADIKEKVNVLLKGREIAFAEFSEETPHNKKVFDNDNISESLEEYDCFICGGDQIWNDWSDWFIYNALDNFSLKFVPNSMKKFSYAPSVPIERVRRVFINRLANNLSRLDDISIRERSSVELLEKTVNRKVQVVVDPVLLLNQEQWDKEMKLIKIS